MKNIIKTFFTFLFFIACINANLSTVYAKDIQYLRVGVGSSSSAINLGSNSVDVYFVLEGGFENMGRIEGNYDFRIVCDDNYYIALGRNYSSYADALYEAENQNVAVLLENGMWSIYAGPYTFLTDEMETIASLSGLEIIEPSEKRICLYDGNNMVALFENDRFTPYFTDSHSDYVTIAESEYRGYLDAHRNGSGLMAVNVVDVEEYLYSTVASEMPSSWHVEALKAQSVAARCYAYSRMGIHSDSGYDLCNNNHCQIYLGLKQEKDSVIQAVQETQGIIAYYDDEIINATFSSSSGGVTDDSENVWSNTIPYLRGVNDLFDTTGKEWERRFTLSELSEIANANNLSLGSVIGVEIAETSSTGRVIKMIIKGTSGNKTLEKEEVRTFFNASKDGALDSRNFRIGSFNITSTGGSSQPVNTVNASSVCVLSHNSMQQMNTNTIKIMNANRETVAATQVNMNIVTASGRQALSGMIESPSYGQALITGGLVSSGNTVTFVGRGWGHGVGLSQHGAKGMAEAGYTFDQILKHYYTGIELKATN